MYVERDVVRQFRKVAKIYPIVAVVGARQAGKTTFLKRQLQKQGGEYLLFDDRDIRRLFEDDVKKFEVQYLKDRVAILDEVQYCKDPGPLMKYLADTGRRLWITSSTETLLSKNVLSYLVGRVSILRFYPFSLPEFLRARQQKAFSEDVLRRLIWEHATYGGYPKVVETADVDMRKTILRDLYETMLLKDTARVFSIEDVESLEQFVLYLAATVGGIISYDRVSRELGLSFRTVRKYLNALEQSYFVRRARPFYRNRTKEIKKQPKVFFVDGGLRSLLVKDFSATPTGEAFENYVYTELLKAGFEPRYWRSKTGAEVDFVVEQEDGLVPMEVKLRSDGRVESGLKAFIEMYKPKRAFVVFYNGERKEETYKGTEVVFCSVLDMLKQKGRVW